MPYVSFQKLILSYLNIAHPYVPAYNRDNKIKV